MCSKVLVGWVVVSVLGALDAAAVVVSALREDTVRACALLPRLPPLLAATEERAAAEPYRLALSACLHIRHVFRYVSSKIHSSRAGRESNSDCMIQCNGHLLAVWLVYH